MKSLGEIKSTRSIKKLPRSRSSKPKGKSGAYLDLYVLNVERERLEKELAVIERRRSEVIGQLTDVNKNINEIFDRKNIMPDGYNPKHPGSSAAPSQDHPKDAIPSWKTISLNY